MENATEHEVMENAAEEQSSVNDIDRHEMEISAEEMKVLQATDPTLRDVRISVKEQTELDFSREIGYCTGVGTT